MLNTTTDTTLELIGHLDFAPPCDEPKGCENTAQWVVHSGPPFCNCKSTDLLCDKHKADYQDPYPFALLTCMKCGATGRGVSFAECLISVEPLHRVSR